MIPNIETGSIPVLYRNPLTAKDQVISGLIHFVNSYRDASYDLLDVAPDAPRLVSQRWAYELYGWLKPFLKELEAPVKEDALYKTPTIPTGVIGAD